MAGKIILPSEEFEKMDKSSLKRGDCVFFEEKKGVIWDGSQAVELVWVDDKLQMPDDFLITDFKKLDHFSNIFETVNFPTGKFKLIGKTKTSNGHATVIASGKYRILFSDQKKIKDFWKDQKIIKLRVKPEDKTLVQKKGNLYFDV